MSGEKAEFWTQDWLTIPEIIFSTCGEGGHLCNLPQFSSNCSSCICISHWDCYTHRSTWKLHFKTWGLPYPRLPKPSVLGQANPAGILVTVVSADTMKNCTCHAFLAQGSHWWGVKKKKKKYSNRGQAHLHEDVYHWTTYLRSRILENDKSELWSSMLSSLGEEEKPAKDTKKWLVR